MRGCGSSARRTRAGDAKRAIAINQRLIPLHQKLFVEANPIPVKWALARMGRIGEGIRLPLTPLAAAACLTIEVILISSTSCVVSRWWNSRSACRT